MFFTDLRQMASEKFVLIQFQFEHAITKFSLSDRVYKTCTLKNLWVAVHVNSVFRVSSSEYANCNLRTQSKYFQLQFFLTLSVNTFKQ